MNLVVFTKLAYLQMCWTEADDVLYSETTEL